MSNNESVSYPTEQIIRINDKSVLVKKLGLISYSKMGNCIKDVIVSIFELLQAQAETIDQINLSPEQKNLAVADVIAKLIDKNVEQLIQLIHVCVPELDIKYIEESVGLEDVLTILDAVLKVNNVNKIISGVKKMVKDYMTE